MDKLHTRDRIEENFRKLAALFLQRKGWKISFDCSGVCGIIAVKGRYIRLTPCCSPA